VTSCNYLARYQTEPLKVLKSHIHTAIKEKRYLAPAAFQVTSHGFCAPDDGIELLETASFLCANYRYSERSVPTQLVKAHARERVDTIKSMGQTVGKEQLREIEADIRQELVLSTPPSITDLQVVFSYSMNEIWILCSGKAQSDKISKRLFTDLKSLPTSLCTLKREWLPSQLQELIDSTDQSFRLHPNYEHFASSHVAQKGSADRIGGIWDEKVEFTLTQNGEILRIKTTDEFKGEWYEEGDQNTPESLEAIALELWVNSISDLTAFLVELQSNHIDIELAQQA